MNTVDVLVAVVVFLNGVIGAFRGFVWQAFRLGSLLLGLFTAYRFSPAVATWSEDWIAWDASGRRVLAFVAVFLVCYLALSGLGYLLRKVLDKARLASADRSLGFMLGGVKGAFFVVLGFYVLLIFYAWLPGDLRTQLEGDPDRDIPPSRSWTLYGRAAHKHLDWVLPEQMQQDAEEGMRQAFVR